MKKQFAEIISEIDKKYDRLIKSSPFKCSDIPRCYENKAGIYVFYECTTPLYVGRTNSIRKRLQNHSRRSHMQATFAFLLARHKTGIRKSTYKPSGSRDDLLRNNPSFAAAFDMARERIRNMDVRVVEEDRPIYQALLEIYTSFVLSTKYNDFDTH